MQSRIDDVYGINSRLKEIPSGISFKLTSFVIPMNDICGIHGV